MAVATGASISGFSALRQSLPLSLPPTASFRPKTQSSAAVSTTNQSTTSESPTNLVVPNGRRTFQNNPEGGKKVPSTSSKKLQEEEEEGERLSVKDYFEQAKVLIESSGGNGNGRPRWFSPLECGARIENSPLLLYLPGIDGVGLGLILQYQKLGKIFDIWCLHIPAKDRTPFQELVLLVEEITRSENQRAPDRPIYLVGESIGGCLALAVAARNPDIDLVLILANPATCYNKLQLQSLQTLLEVVPTELSLLSLPYTFSLMTGEPLKLALSSVNKEPVMEHTLNQLFHGISELSSYLSVLADVLPRDTLLWKLQLMKSASSFANSRLHAVKAQILILASGRDPLLPNLEEAERIRGALPKQEVRVLASTGEMPRCDIRKFNDSGHFLFLEDDVDLVTIIKGVSFYRSSRSHDYVSDYLPPTESEVKKTVESFRWIKTAADPVMLSTLEDGTIVRGLAGIPDEGPVLFVGYHMLMGVEIYPLVMDFMEERNILLRGVAHPMLFTKLREDAMDLASFDAYRIMGAVPVSASNLFKLFSSGSHILLYPGGMREALHKKGEAYQLFWPERSEFVRMAARFGAKIIPFGVVGEDDVFELVADYEDQMRIPILKEYIENMSGQAIRLRDESQGEVANQVGYLPGLLPKLPGRFYFLFGKPIDTAGMKQELRDREEAHKLYLHVKSEVERNISYLKEKREKDPYRSFAARTLYQATHGWTSEIPTFEL